MKNNILVTVLISLSLLLPGCSFNKKSTMDRLKKKSDSVEAMKFPEKESPSGLQDVELIDNKKLKQIKPQQEAKKIRVTGTKVSLRRGPGPKYIKIGNAVKGD
jgi:uncharacterized lipoprotein